jgi:hypothetical protein
MGAEYRRLPVVDCESQKLSHLFAIRIREVYLRPVVESMQDNLAQNPLRRTTTERPRSSLRAGLFACATCHG